SRVRIPPAPPECCFRQHPSASKSPIKPATTDHSVYQAVSACITSFQGVIGGRNRGKVMAKIDLLSAAKVKNLKVPGDYLDGRGLYLQVRSESSKSWLLKFSMQKRAREMGLGSALDFSLADARETRDKYRKLIKVGVDPIEHRKAEEAARAADRARALTF